MQSDLTDDELLKVLKSRPDYFAPNIYDDELDKLITERGLQTARLKKQKFLWIMIVGLVLGALAGLFVVFTALPLTYPTLALFYLAYFSFGYIVGMHRASLVAQTYKSGRHDLTAKLLPSAVWWNTMWYPFTLRPLLACQNVELQMLLHEGRVLELEAHSRFLMSLISPARMQKSRFLPRLQNNIWLSWMLAGRYAEAAAGFSSVDLTKTEKVLRPILLNNLALCQVKSGDPESAQKTLALAFAEVANQPRSFVRPRLEYIQASIYLEQNELTSAEAAIEKAKSLAEKIANRELEAECMVLSGRLLTKLKRYDEASLYFKSAIEIFSSTDNTHFLSLCFAMHYYAQMLLESGQEKSALKVMHKIADYNESYRQREENTSQRLKNRLRSTATIKSASDLLTLSERETLIELGTIDT